MAYIPRKIEEILARNSRFYPVLAITGPRQSGKTTTCQHVFPGAQYFSFEDPDIKKLVAEDPRGFLNSIGRCTVILDEVQRYPEILSYIQGVVDKEKVMGHFILTGSAQFELLESVSQSLAGRVSIHTLLPFELAELPAVSEDTDLLLFQGSYPAIFEREIPSLTFYRNYVRTFVERDVRKIANIKDLTLFQKLLGLVAGRAGQTFEYSELSSAVGVSAVTIKEWMTIMEAAFIIYRLPTYSKNIKKRIVKSPKLYFHDTGLLCYLLDIFEKTHLSKHPHRGHIFENFVVSEINKQVLHREAPAKLFYYHDSHKKQVDLVIERGVGIDALEIKSAETFHVSFLKNLPYFQEQLTPGTVKSYLLYDGENSTSVGNVEVSNFRKFLLNL